MPVLQLMRATASLGLMLGLSAPQASEVAVPYRDDLVQVDGMLDEPAWVQVPQTAPFVNNRNGEPVAFRTTARLFHARDALYLGLQCPSTGGPRTAGDGMPSVSEVTAEDSVEIFLDPGRTRSRYYQIIINVHGAAVAGFNGVYHAPRTVQFAVHQVGNDWSLEVRIPYETLGAIPYAGDVWGLNLFRTRPGSSDGQRSAQLAWKPTKSGYRKPHLFGSLLFCGRSVPGALVDDQEETQKRILDRVSRDLGGQGPWGPQDMNSEEAATRAVRLTALIPRICRLGESVLVAGTKAVTNDPVFPWTVPPRDSLDPGIQVAACPGEFEPASFVLFAARDLRSVTIEASGLVGPAGRTLGRSAVDLRQVVCWYQAGWANVYADARTLVPELLLRDGSLIEVDYVARENKLHFEGFPTDAETLQPLDLRAFESRQFWVTFHPPAGTAPGEYRGIFKVRCAGTVLATIPVRLVVYPFALKPPVLSYSLYYRLRPSQTGDPRATMQRMAEDLRNQVEHGINMPCTYVGSEPLEAGGPKMQTLEELTRVYRELGLRDHPLILVTTAIGRQSDPEQLERIRGMVRELVAWARRRGYSDVYLQAIDEGGNDVLRAERPAMQAVHEAGGKVFVACGVDYFDAAGDLLDMPVLGGALVPEVARKARALGHRVFSYANPQAGVEAPQTYRRNYGLKLWAAGYSGGFNYEYQSHEIEKAYDDFRDGHYRNHTMAYPAHGRPIDTRQWEGWREAVDDVRYLSTLLEIIDREEAAGRQSSTTQEARRWIARISGDEELDTLRRRMAQWIVRLTANEATNGSGS